nr:BLUF domain-containing protein [Corynebacterium cystitidis]
MDSLKYLVYSSAAAGTPNEDTMEDIMEVAQAHNSSVDITGFLIAPDFTYVQFLEGLPKRSILSWIRFVPISGTTPSMFSSKNQHLGAGFPSGPCTTGCRL